MAVLKNCAACDELRNDAPNLVVNGMTSTECTSLKNNTGLNPSSGNNDCTDLDNMNDCLIGNLYEEVDMYDVCDWKEFTKNMLDNVWTMFKAIICAICGLWIKVTNILSRLSKLECIFNNLNKNQNFAIGEENIKWFNGVTKNPDSSTDPDLALPRLVGNAYVGYMTGSIILPSDWTTRFPNSGLTVHGALLYEYRIKLSDFNLARLYNGNMQENAGGDGIHAHIFRFDAGDTPYGAGNTGNASYTVPNGYSYLQVRMSSYDSVPSSGKVTLSGVIPVLMNPNGFDC